MTSSRISSIAQRTAFADDDILTDMPNGPRAPANLADGVAAVGLILVALSMVLPWLRVGAAGTARFYTGIQLPVLAVVMLALTLSSLVCLAVERGRRSRDAGDLATLGAGAAVCLSGVILVLVECASAVIPNGLLPATIRRYTLDLRAGPGLWLAVAASAIALAALSGKLPTGAEDPLAGRGMRLSARPVAALTALTALAVAFGVLRYAAWIDATAVGQRYGIGGWGLPWVGPLSLVAMLGLIAAAALVVAGREQAAALLAGASGWLITVTAALTIIASDTLASVRFVDFAPANLRGDVPHLSPGAAAPVSFAVGLAAVAVAAALLAATSAEAVDM